jgi:hypothetical protein
VWPILGGDGCGCAFPIAIVINTLVGVPLTIRFFSGRTYWWQVAFAGLVVGALPFLAFDAYFAIEDWPHHTDLPWQIRFTAAGAACGAITATLFWWMVGRKFLASDPSQPG